MKLLFDDLIIGGGPHYYLEDDPRGLDGKIDNVQIRIPRSDFMKDIDDFLEPKIRTFSGTIIGDDEDDYRERRRKFVNYIRQTFSFTLIDDYSPNSQSDVQFEKYEFDGKIIEIRIKKSRSNMCEFTMKIFSEDPRLYLATPITKSLSIEIAGFTFPITFPFIFSGVNNSIELSNNGLTTAYPTYTITGGASDVVIVNGNNEQFLYNESIPTGAQIFIDTSPTDPIKVRDADGNSLVQNTNSNFKALELEPGLNSLAIFAGSDIDSSTLLEISYKQPFLGI
jgi:hypothetical protein